MCNTVIYSANRVGYRMFSSYFYCLMNVDANEIKKAQQFTNVITVCE